MQLDGSGVKEIFKIIKAPYILSTISLGSGLLLFLPDKLIKKMYLLNFRDKSGFILGLLFFFSTILLTIMILIKVYKFFENKYISKKFRESTIKYLTELKNETEIEVIKMLLKEDDYTLELPMNSGVIIKLQQCGIITPAGSTHFVSMPSPEIPYFLQPYVIKCIEEDEKLKKKFEYNI